MPITTSVSPSYYWRMLIIAILCVVFGLWGAYDMWIKYPADDKRYEDYMALTAELSNATTEAERARIDAEMAKLAPGGSQPTDKHSQADYITQWFFIACLPCAPYFWMLASRARKQKYTLEEDGTLRFEGDKERGAGAWTRDQIADIDMSRWMAKSIAHVVHADGTRLKLDAYLHKRLELIVGAIAHRLKPEEWTEDARPASAAEPAAAGEPAQAAEQVEA